MQTKTRHRTLAQRLLEKIDMSGGPDSCWPWTACIDGGGYGHIGAGGKYGGMLKAHRVSYELLVGPIPPGLELDHLCRNRKCVNPAHLEPVTHRENGLRGVGVGAKNAAKTHCTNGHPLSGDNLRISKRGWRECQTCLSVRNLAHTQKRRNDPILRAKHCLEERLRYYRKIGRPPKYPA